MLNFVAIHGRLVRDPEMRQTQSGVSVCNFTVAVDRSHTRQGEDRQADFFDVVAWRGLGETVGKYFQKGKEIVVTGEMQSRKWQDKDGNNRVSWEIQANSVDFCGNKGDNAAGSSSARSLGDPIGTLGDVIGSRGFEDMGEESGELPF